MATWTEAIAHMQEKPTNTAGIDALHLYRIRDGQIERGYWKGGMPWEPYVPSNDLIVSDNWQLTEAF